MRTLLFLALVTSVSSLSISNICYSAPYSNITVLSEYFTGYLPTNCALQFTDPPSFDTAFYTITIIGLTYNNNNQLQVLDQVSLTLNRQPVAWSIQSYTYQNLQGQSTPCPSSSQPFPYGESLFLQNCAGFSEPWLLLVPRPPSSTPRYPWLWNVPWSTWFIIAGLPSLGFGVIVGVLGFLIGLRWRSKRANYVSVN